MPVRKRFIAGAVCPHCQIQDLLVIWRENGVEVVECVNCGSQMQNVDQQIGSYVRSGEKVIGIFPTD